MNIDLDTIRRANAARQREWDGNADFSLLFFSNALAGEAGEVANVVKKMERHRMGLRGSIADPNALGFELADVLTYTDLTALRADLDLGYVFVRKFNEVSAKYGMRTHFQIGNDDVPRLIL